MWAYSSLGILEEMVLTFVSRVPNKNLGSLLHPTSPSIDEANCNKKQAQVA
jgi:hypothetical protein